MYRVILVDQDLSGQAIKGLPFSYIGNCTGTDITLTGDWTHLSYFHNDLARLDLSRAQTCHSYGRFNVLADVVTSEDMNTDDHDMLLAAIDESLPKLEGIGREAMAKAGDLLRADIEKGLYLISWAQVAPVFLGVFQGDFKAALETVVIGFSGKKQFTKRWSGTARDTAGAPCWAEVAPPTRSVEGITADSWGVVARNKKGKEYRKHWTELPTPTNPHDRLEMAELIDAEVLAAIGLEVTTYVHSILRWGASARAGKLDRDWYFKRPAE